MRDLVLELYPYYESVIRNACKNLDIDKRYNKELFKRTLFKATVKRDYEVDLDITFYITYSIFILLCIYYTPYVRVDDVISSCYYYCLINLSMLENDKASARMIICVINLSIIREIAFNGRVLSGSPSVISELCVITKVIKALRHFNKDISYDTIQKVSRVSDYAVLYHNFYDNLDDDGHYNDSLNYDRYMQDCVNQHEMHISDYVIL